MKEKLIFAAMLLSFFGWSSNGFAGQTTGGIFHILRLLVE